MLTRKNLLALGLFIATTGYCADNAAEASFQEGFYALQVEMHQGMEKAEIELNKSKDISKKLKSKVRAELEKVKTLEEQLQKVAATPDVSGKLKGKLLKEFNKVKEKKKRVKKEVVERFADDSDNG